jgi:hypothetical protein
MATETPRTLQRPSDFAELTCQSAKPVTSMTGERVGQGVFGYRFSRRAGSPSEAARGVHVEMSARGFSCALVEPSDRNVRESEMARRWASLGNPV